MQIKYLGEYEDKHNNMVRSIFFYPTNEKNLYSFVDNIEKKLDMKIGYSNTGECWGRHFAGSREITFINNMSYDKMIASKAVLGGHKLDMAILAIRINKEIKNES